MHYLFFDISHRDIRIQRPWGEEILPFLDLERNFPGKLYKIFDHFPDVKDIYVLNGPGSFTTLRIACLCLNLMQLWRKNTLHFHSLTKIDLFQYGYQQWVLPRYSLVWIGQAKNIWEVDLETGEREKVGKDEKMEREEDGGKQYFVDESIGEGYDAPYILCTDDWITLQYGEKILSLHTLWSEKSEKYISPEYMVEI